VELGGRRWPGSGGNAGKLGPLEVGDGADSWGPVDRETRERRPARKARTKRENVFPMKTPARTILACGGSESSGLAGPEAAWAARSVGPKIRKKEFLN
jgi:hypothetical protein